MADQVPSDEELQRSAKLSEYLSAQSASYDKIVQSALQLGDKEKAREILQTKYAANAKNATNEMAKQLAGMVKANQISKQDAANYLKKETSLRAQGISVKVMRDLEKNIEEIKKRQNDYLDKQGTKIEKITRNLKEQAKSAETYKGIGGSLKGAEDVNRGHVETGMEKGSEITAMAVGLGPVGQAIFGIVTQLAKSTVGLKSIGEVAAATIGKAAASTGGFSKTFDNTFDKLANSMLDLKSDASLIDKTGLSFKELTGKMAEAAAVGIKIGDAINIPKIQQLDAAALATGQTLGSISSIMVTLRRNTKNFGDVGEEALKVAQDAQTVARQDIMSTTEYTHSLQGLATELADLNIDTNKLSSNFKSLLVNISKLGVSSEMTKRLTGELTKSFHATGDEWKAFIGSMSGAGGGFVGGLFKTQQRGAGGDLLTRQVDQTKYLKEVVSSIKDMTAGIADPDQQLYMMETLGKQMGLTAEATQALLKGVTSGSADSADTMDQMLKAQQKAEKMSKDWLERLIPVIDAYVTKFLKAILDAINAIVKRFGGKTVDMDKLASDAQKDAQTRAGVDVTGAGKASGGTINDTGMILAHRNEEILDARTAQDYRSGKMGGNGGISVNVTVNAQQNLKAAFDEAYQKTLRAVQKSNSYAFGL